MHKLESVVIIHIYPLPLEPLSYATPLGGCRAPGGVLCVIKQLPASYLFHTIVCIYQCYFLNLHTSPTPLRITNPVKPSLKHESKIKTFSDFFLNFYFYFILLYNTVLVLPYIDMNPPRVYMSSQTKYFTDTLIYKISKKYALGRRKFSQKKGFKCKKE